MKGRSYLLKTLKRINIPFRNMIVIRNLLSSMCSDKWSSAVRTRNLRDSGLVLVIQQIFVLLISAFGFRFYIYKRCILYRYTGIEITHDKHGTLAEKKRTKESFIHRLCLVLIRTIPTDFSLTELEFDFQILRGFKLSSTALHTSFHWELLTKARTTQNRNILARKYTQCPALTSKHLDVFVTFVKRNIRYHDER